MPVVVAVGVVVGLLGDFAFSLNREVMLMMTVIQESIKEE